MAPAVIGRAGELDAIERFLDALADGPALLVLEGEPGIGKTTLVRAAVGAAHARGARVLYCVASAAEARLAYAALTELIGDVDGDAVERLPAPQREALDAALLRSHPAAGEVDGRAVATAVRSLLVTLAAKRPVVIAIDDLQWLDRPTARVVEFCVRRLRGGVGLLASRRAGTNGGLGGDDVRRLQPLSADDLQRLLRERAPAPLTRRSLARIHAASGGNPFYALELARALPAGRAASAALPLPSTLEDVVGARLAELGEEAEEALLAVAALAKPTVALLEQALGPGVTRRLEAVEERGVIELDGPVVRFAHPLLAHGVYARASAGRRRAMHRRLSSVVPDLEERARHLAFAGIAPDAVAALDAAARYVRARGAPDSAAELLELALEQGGDEALRVRAAEYHVDAGDLRRAQVLLEEAILALPAGEERARALLLLAEAHYKDDSFPAARERLEQAQAEAGLDERLRVMVDLRLTFTLFNLGLVPDADVPACSALARAEQVGDPALLAQAMAVSVMVDFTLGRGVDEQRLGRALALENPDLRTGSEFLPSLIGSFIYLWTGRFDESRALLDALFASHADRGEEQAFAWARSFRVILECWSGDLASAVRAADEGVERLHQLDTTIGHALASNSRAQVDAYAGRADEARRGAERALELLERAGWLTAMASPLTTLGFLELSLGRPEAAAARLGPIAAQVVATGLPEPAAAGALLTGDAAEALIAVGRTEEAEAIVELLEARGAALGRTWAIAVGARCRGLLLAAGGDVGAAEQALERALVAHERLPMPLERARSLLVLGRIRRRLRKRLAAKAVLAEALAIFKAVGSPHWAAQASAEIACLGLRPRASDRLTPSEERVARLAASGLTNQEVASCLIISPKTVEAQLSRAYRKLGIRSRAELGARMGQRLTPIQRR